MNLPLYVGYSLNMSVGNVLARLQLNKHAQPWKRRWNLSFVTRINHIHYFCGPTSCSEKCSRRCTFTWIFMFAHIIRIQKNLMSLMSIPGGTLLHLKPVYLGFHETLEVSTSGVFLWICLVCTMSWKHGGTNPWLYNLPFWLTPVLTIWWGFLNVLLSNKNYYFSNWSASFMPHTITLTWLWLTK